MSLKFNSKNWNITVMRKLEAVEEARAIMTQGKEWGVFKWLMEKRKVRGIADRATAALNEAEDKVKATWSDDLKRAYNFLATQNGDAARKEGASPRTPPRHSIPRCSPSPRKYWKRTRRQNASDSKPKIPSPKESAG